ncbi:MAG: serine hydrolase domain-containing protein [Hyphomicrobium sp.]|uniref:serine hydrolase domain-containing protein n=1 Tax=Hyphomicrobium sp. TaxID=82 RepID=UPI0039E26B02
MRRKAFSISLISIGCLFAWQDLARAEPEDLSLAAQTANLVQNFMASRTDERSSIIPAMSVAIGRDGTLLYADGYGQAGPGRTATAATIYMVGSITKQFTAAAILRLIERGATINGRGEKLETTTAVADVLDEARAWQLEGGPPITVSNLLSMTSNLPNYTRRPPHELDPWGAVPARQLLTGIKEYRPSGYPGSFEYSNTSYFLLSEIMEDVEIRGVSRSYRDILRDEVFSRLGLDHTGFAGDANVTRALASPNYRRRPRFFQPDWLKGSGDVASSVLDIFKWDTALMQGAALTARMRDVVFADAGRVDAWTYYGAGWFVTHKNGIDRYFHSGTVSGYTSYNLIVRNSNEHWLSVSLLANADGIEDIDTLADQIAQVALPY